MVEKENAHSLTIVVPVYNEADALPGFLPELVETSREKGWQIIFVDDGSTDGSSLILAGYETNEFVKIIRHKVNHGYGGALKSGIISSTTSYTVTIDGDGQHKVTDIEPMLAFAIEQEADLVVGNRGRWKDASLFREFGKGLIRLFTRMLMPLPIHDINSGFKLYKTELIQRYVSLCPNTMAFSDVATLTFIHQRNYVLEFPITVGERKTGKSTIGLHTAVDTLLEIINIILLFNPLRVFLPLATTFISLGLAWGIPIILLGRGVSVGAMLAIVTGLLFFILGLVASQLSAIRRIIIEDPRLHGNTKP